MSIDFIHPFIDAAREVISKETGGNVVPGKLSLKKSCGQTNELAVLVGITGQLQGTVILMMPPLTAFSIVEHMIGEPCHELDDMVRSAIAEMTNVISGHAATRLAENGRETSVSPPTVFCGVHPDQLSTLNIPLVSVPMETGCGQLELQVALRDAA